MPRSIPSTLTLLALLAACGPVRSSMIDHRAMEAQRGAQFYAAGDTLVVRFVDPMGGALVLYEPSLDEGRVVLNAGVTSSGGGGERVACFDVSALAPPAAWADHVYWREPDGALTHVTEVDRGDAARAEAARCASQ